MKVFIVHASLAYVRMFIDEGWEVVDNIYDADLVQFTGGEDVSPHLYGEEPHPWTGNSVHRDRLEQEAFKMVANLGKPMAGICRGGQFLNVMNGGKMYQHCDGHGISHTHEVVDLPTGEKHQVTSTHHQMMRAGSVGKVIATAKGLSSFRESVIDGEVVRDSDIHADTEVVYYNNTSSLCFQPHPEFNGVDECRKYYFKLIERHLGLKA